MNSNQFKYIIHKKYGIDTMYWAPEVVLYKFRESYVYDPQNTFQTAAIILHINEESFKNRILKMINDQWFSKVNFEPLINDMIDILTLLNDKFNDPKCFENSNQLDDWQKELLNQLKLMK